MDGNREWNARIDNWMRELDAQVLAPVCEIGFEYAVTDTLLTPAQADALTYAPAPAGMRWGEKWQYGWFRARFAIPESCASRHAVIAPRFGGDSLVYINGRAEGAIDQRHACVTLTEAARAGEIYTIQIETYAGHGPIIEHIGPTPPGRRAYPPAEGPLTQTDASVLCVWDEDAYGLLMDARALIDLYQTLAPRSLRAEKVYRALCDMTLIVDFELDDAAMRESFRAARARLRAPLICVNGSTAPAMAIFGQSHIDLAWQWPLEETRHKIGRTMATQLNLLKAFPDAKYLLCQPALIEMLARDHVDLYNRTLAYLREGRVFADGCLWSECDMNMPWGECVIRQLTYGRAYFRDVLSTDSRTVWHPDAFGFSPQLPQIFAGCGVRYFATKKLYDLYEGGDPFPYNLFYWRGIDGTRVLSLLFKRNNAPLTVKELSDRWTKDRRESHGEEMFLFPYGYGDGGGGPTRDHLETAARAGDLEGAPRAKYSTLRAYFERAETCPDIPTYAGEMYFAAHRGAYTSQARTKRLSRRAEAALRACEMIGELTRTYRDLNALWKTLLLNQFHDILPGTGIARVTDEAERALAGVAEDADKIVRETLIKMAAPGDAVSVFNPCCRARREKVPVPADWPGAAANETPVPVFTRNGQKYALAPLPPLSVTCVTPSRLPAQDPGACASARYDARSGEYILENALIRAAIDSLGRVASFYDKTLQMELAASRMNDMRLYKDVTNHYDAWDIDSMYRDLPVPLTGGAEIKIAYADLAGACLTVRRRFHDSELTQNIVLPADRGALRFETRVRWAEKHKLLKVDFPTVIQTDQLISETQFGLIRRPNHASRAYDRDRFEVCQHRFSCLLDGGAGFAVLNDCKYGVSAFGSTISLTLLKSALIPDERAEAGEHAFAYEIRAFPGAPALPEVIGDALLLNQPAYTAPGAAARAPLARCDRDEIVIDSVRVLPDGRTIMRLYESTGATVRCFVSLPGFVSAAVTDMAGDSPIPLTLKDGGVTLAFSPFRVVTVVGESV